MFVSDIHGNVEVLKKVVELYEMEEADKLVILGDTAASSNREDNVELAKILNSMKEKVEVLRGNCDTMEFENLLDFEMFDDDILYVNGKFISISHGHYYNDTNLPPNCGEIFIQGHTHIPMLIKEKAKILANPGSMTRPRGVDLRCYLFMDEEKIALKTWNKVIVKEIFLR